MRPLTDGVLADANLIIPSHQLKEGKGSTKITPRFLHDPRAKMLTKFISIAEVRAGTLIKSTKVVRLIICKTL